MSNRISTIEALSPEVETAYNAFNAWLNAQHAAGIPRETIIAGVGLFMAKVANLSPEAWATFKRNVEQSLVDDATHG